MIDMGQILGKVPAMALPVVVAAVFYIAIRKHSHKIETGMMGALGYGVLGYLWQQLFYLMTIVLIARVEVIQNVIESFYVLLAFVYGLICSVFVALGLYWGIYLTNQKQHSLYRSVTVGIGFGLGNVVWNFATSTAALYQNGLKCMLMLVIYVGIAHVMSGYYLEGKRVPAWLTPILVQLFISFSNAIMNRYMPQTSAKAGIYILLCIMAAVGLYRIISWLRNH